MLALRNMLVALFLMLPVVAHAADDAVAPTAAAQNGTEITDPTERAAALTSAENYLNGIKTMQAHFEQANQDGSIDSGDFYLSRPGRLRFEYAAPKKDYIVADGLFVHFWDDSMKHHSNAPIGATLADFLLKKHISLTGDLKVIGLRRPAPGSLVITLVQTKNVEAGDLRLLFSDAPMQLEKWRVTDGNGNITEVTLSNQKAGVTLDPRLFIFKAPKGYENEASNKNN